MLNLLFISDSPKIEYVKGVLQPLLKVIIDVVTDFDHGLKDVFEKRPATVCIQDQINGVTGESVARHIQMLLGTSAPTFILLHNGNGRGRGVNGLYEQLIDLSQPDDAVAEEVKNTLKSLLGDQWEKVYIPPRLTPASVRSAVAVPEASREDAERLVDDFLSDLETSVFGVADAQPPVAPPPDEAADESPGATQFETPLKAGVLPATVASERAQAIDDDLAELLLMVENERVRDESSAAAPAAGGPWAGAASVESPKPATAAVMPPFTVIPEPPAAAEASYPDLPFETPPTPRLKGEAKGSKAAVTPQQRPPAAEFRISQDATPAEEGIPEGMLLEFEENYRPKSRLLRRTVAVLLLSVVCAAGAWHLLRQKPQPAVSPRQRIISTSVAKRAGVTVPPQKPAPSPQPQPVTAPALPSFIPKDGHDSSFALKNPGWERYVGKFNEFRIFGAPGRILAVQVLAVKDAPISEPVLRSVLREFAGSSEYRITSRSIKAGVHVENGRIRDKGAVVIYRKNGAVKAFVVSAN